MRSELPWLDLESGAGENKPTHNSSLQQFVHSLAHADHASRLSRFEPLQLRAFRPPSQPASKP